MNVVVFLNHQASALILVTAIYISKLITRPFGTGFRLQLKDLLLNSVNQVPIDSDKIDYIVILIKLLKVKSWKN